MKASKKVDRSLYVRFRKAAPALMRRWLPRQLAAVFYARAEARQADEVLFDLQEVLYEMEGSLPKELAPALIATGTGLYQMSHQNVAQLLHGCFFGITRYQDNWLVFQKTGEWGRILKFNLTGDRLQNLEVLIDDLAGTIHQMDVIDQRLFVIDPRSNRILIFDLRGRLQDEMYPVGKLSEGKTSPNYAHLNSVYAHGDNIFVVAHNYTQKSGRPSELLIFDRRCLQLVERIENIGACAHNTIVLNGARLSCDSLSGRLRYGERVLLETGYFTRGLAMNDHHLLMGGSMYGERAQRIGKDGFIYVLKRSFEKLCVVKLNGCGPIFDLRFMGLDYGLSHPFPNKAD